MIIYNPEDPLTRIWCALGLKRKLPSCMDLDWFSTEKHSWNDCCDLHRWIVGTLDPYLPVLDLKEIFDPSYTHYLIDESPYLEPIQTCDDPELSFTVHGF